MATISSAAPKGDYTVTGNPQVDAINAARAQSAGAGMAPSLVNSIGRNTVTGTTPPVSTSGVNTAYVPVITSSKAQNDYASKQDAFATMQANNALQASQLAQQTVLEQQAQADQARQAQEQANIDTQNKQNQQTIDAKNAALGLTTQASTSPVPTTNTQNGTTTQTGTIDAPRGTPGLQGGVNQPVTGQDSINQANNGIVGATNDLTSGLQDVQDAKDSLANTVNRQLQSVLKGTFPLTGPQQDLINSLQTQLNQQIAEQKVTNAAYVGSVSRAGFRSGTEEYGPDEYAGQIANAVSYGTAKIQELDNSAAKTMADLESGFQKDDYDMITKNYDILDKQLDDKGNHIKDMYNAVTSVLKDQRDQELASQAAATKQAQDAKDFDEKVREFNSTQDLAQKKYGLDAAQYQHQLEVDASSGISSVDDAGLTMLAKGYLTSGTLPSVGYGKQAVAIRTAIINKAVQLSGGAGNVDPAVNKAAYEANKAVLKSQQQSYTVADNAYRVFDKNGDLALSLAKGLNNSNSPIINQLSNSVINQTTGQGQLDSYKAILTSLQSEYATLISVKGGGSGQVTEADKAKAEAAIPSDISPKRLQEVLTNLKTEGSNVLSERKQTLDQLNENMTTHASTFNNQVSEKPLVGQVSSAKAAGYSSSEIVSSLATNPQYANAVSTAKALGYGDDEIINYLTQ